MGFFDKTIYDQVQPVQEDSKEMKKIIETFIVEYFCNAEEEVRKAFVVSEECKVMVEQGTLTEASVIYLDKLDDLARRTSIIATQKAKAKSDPLVVELEKVIERKKKIQAKIDKKYGRDAFKDAKYAQKEYIKEVPTAFKKKITIK